MNLFKYHTNELKYHQYKQYLVPKYALGYLTDNPSTNLKNIIESIIAKHVEYSYRYSRAVLKCRFEMGENVIATDAGWSYWYSLDVLKGRFVLGENTIAKSAYWSYSYALDVLHGRFELGEEIINKSEFNTAYQNLLSTITSTL